MKTPERADFSLTDLCNFLMPAEINRGQYL
uniref:Uncharacterized protein n=1 Tax=Anguilla anguilla TaxID=7936 RepID=A0A0E9QP95_ANGAN